MANQLKIHSILRCVALLILSLTFINCSGANFGGEGDGRSTVPQPNDNFSDPLDEPDEKKPDTPTPDSDGEYKVYQATLIDYDISFDTKTVQINIEPQNEEILLFVHVISPVKIVLKGDTDAVAGLFLTANSIVSTSTAVFTGDSPFPPAYTATGFLPYYLAGAGLNSVIGTEAVNQWNSGVVVEQFAKEQGPVKCFDLNYDSAIEANPSFSLSWSQGQSCLFP